ESPRPNSSQARLARGAAREAGRPVPAMRPGVPTVANRGPNVILVSALPAVVTVAHKQALSGGSEPFASFGLSPLLAHPIPRHSCARAFRRLRDGNPRRMATKIQRARRIGGMASGAVKTIFRTGRAWGTARMRVAMARRPAPTVSKGPAAAAGVRGAGA